MVRKIDNINKLLVIKSGQRSIYPFEEKNKSINTNWLKTNGILQYMNNSQNIAPKSTNAKKIRTIRGVIIDAVRETPDTWTLDIFVGDEDKDYKAGQFISISPHQFGELADLIKYFEYIKNKKEVVRAYSLTSAPGEKYISITIKPESYNPEPGALPPLLSPFLASDLLVGREIEFIGYAGAFVMPEELREHTDHVVHLVAGSGAVPSLSIIKDELVYKNNTQKHTLIFVNKIYDDIIFHEQLKKLSVQFPENLEVHYFLSQDNSAPGYGKNYFYGRPTHEHVAKLITNKDRTVLFACGPAITKWQKKQALLTNSEIKPRFMEWVHDVVEKLGIDKKRYKREIYG
jgi:ferredoxin-NADP reductase